MGSKTVAIIGARLSSTRLPGKQLLPLAGQPLIAHIVQRLRQVSEIDEIIVATTNEDVNKPLVNWARGFGITAFDWDGDQNDVVGRVDAALAATDADHFVYVCGDCPFIEPTTISNLIKASRSIDSEGFARLAPPQTASKFIHEGFDVFNKGFWDRMVAVAAKPFEREHIGAVYFHLNKVEPMTIKLVTEDESFAAIDHRLSVDTKQDYAFAQRLYDEWYNDHAPDTIVDLKWVIKKLVSDPTLVALNAHVHQKAVKQQTIHAIILCEAGPSLGMGHLSRACVVAASLQEYLGASVKIVIRGSQIDFSDLANIPHQWVSSFDQVALEADCIITDLKTPDQSIGSLLNRVAGQTYRVAIDQPTASEDEFDQIWMPSIHVSDSHMATKSDGFIRYGAECFLLRRPSHIQPSGTDSGKKLIVLTGGADPKRLSKTLPQQLMGCLDANTRVTWVQGPYAEPPEMQEDERFVILQNPASLHQLVSEFDAALCVYGVTFFECLQSEVPVVTFDPIGAATPEEWIVLQRLAPGFAASSTDEALALVAVNLSADLQSELPLFATDLKNGPENFARAVEAGVARKRERSDAAA